jgi:hypothetical protein
MTLAGVFVALAAIKKIAKIKLSLSSRTCNQAL